MEVTHVDDMTTHVVMSANKSLAVSMVDSPEIMHLLSGALYKNPAFAMIREVLCNAQDAHIEAGIPETPFQISITESRLIVRDFGKGIPHDLIAEIYGTYGKSTKKQDANQTGGFGLGSKSPWSFTDVFGVTSFCGGTKTIYRMVKADPENEGKPGIYPILQTPTEETGLEVSIPLGSVNTHTLIMYIKTVVAFGEMFAEYQGNLLSRIPFSKSKHGYTFVSGHYLSGYYHDWNTVNIKYGSVVYPVSSHESYNGVLENIKQAFRVGSQYSKRGQAFLVLEAEPNSLSVSPSRDNLTLENKTIKAVKKLLEDFLNKFLKKDNCYDGAVKHYVRNNISNYGTLPALEIGHNKLDFLLMMRDHRNTISKIEYENYLESLYKVTRNKKLIRTAEELHNCHYKDKKQWFFRYILHPFKDCIDGMNVRLTAHILYRRGMGSISYTPLDYYKKNISNLNEVVSLSLKYVIITSSRSDMSWKDVEKLPNSELCKEVFVVTTRSKKKEVLESIGSKFEEEGYTVLNKALNDWKPAVKRVRTPKATSPTNTLFKSYAKFSDCIGSLGNGYTIKTAQGIKRCVAPVAYITQNDPIASSLLDSAISLRVLSKMLPDDLACVTKRDVKVMEEAGIPHIWKYFYDVLWNWHEKHKQDIHHHAQNQWLQKKYGLNSWKKTPNEKILEEILHSQVLCEALNFPPMLDYPMKAKLGVAKELTSCAELLELYPEYSKIVLKDEVTTVPARITNAVSALVESPYLCCLDIPQLRDLGEGPVIKKFFNLTTKYTKEV